MHIVVVGLNHRTAPIELRERLAFRAEQLPAAYAALQHEVGLPESLILSTCNRVEIYAGASQPDPAETISASAGVQDVAPRIGGMLGAAGVPAGLHGTCERLSAFLNAHGRFANGELRERLYVYTEPRSIEHLFAVAGGLDSMVLGETEILHQVKGAYEQAQRYGTAGKALNVLFQKALNAGKTVQTRTAIGRGCVSVGSVAIEFARKIFGDLSPYTVLLLGAGKIGELTLKRLAARGVSRVRILNRSRERAQVLASAYGGSAYGLEQLSAQLMEADIVITSTSAPGFLITRPQVSSLMPVRRQRPLCLIDLGVPRNVEPATGELENVYLFDIDDLQGLVAHAHTQRRQAVQESEAIIQQKVHHFLSWWHEEGAKCAEPSSSVLAAAP